MAGRKARVIVVAPEEIIGTVVDYILTAEDARRMNEKRGPELAELEPGERWPLTIEYSHGGDCVDGRVMAEGTELLVERTNRGFGLGQWDWVRKAA